jgi:DNA-binding transcriptional ArsR family regulator
MNQLIKYKSRQLIAKSLGAKLLGGKWHKGGVELYVGMIALKTGLSQPLVTHHLKAMGEMVESEYRHPRVYFRLSEKFEEIANEYTEKPLILGKNQQKILNFLKENDRSRPMDICPGMCRVTVSITLRSLRSHNLVSFEQSKRARYYFVK